MMTTLNHTFTTPKGNFVKVYRTHAMAKANGFVGRSGSAKVAYAVVNDKQFDVPAGATFKAYSIVVAAGY